MGDDDGKDGDNEDDGEAEGGVTLLPPGRRLRRFSEQPLHRLRPKLEAKGGRQRRQRERLLIMWAFESRLKELFGTLLGALDGALADSVLHTRRKALSTAHALLRSRPEGEQRPG